MIKTFYRNIRIAWSMILIIFAFATDALPDILNVPSDYLTIQEAIYASEPGDTIMVGSGVYRLYSGNITVVRESIIIKSAEGAEKTIIEGRGKGPVITFPEKNSSVIEGFTITSIGKADHMDIKHAGTVSRTLNGGGIYCASSSSPTITNNIICGNSAVFGGGIYCAPSSSPAIVGNVISKNNAARFGGGLFSCKASPSVRNNRITENETSGSGGGIFCRRASLRVTNNIIWKNKAESGGGISCERSSCAMVNNTIAENRATYGGGLFFHGGSVRIINTIFRNNEDDLYAGRISPAVRPDHSNISDGDFLGLNGNIKDDPLFADPKNGDFHLMPDSPCINGGNPAPIYNDPDGSRNNMGAFGGPGAYFGRQKP